MSFFAATYKNTEVVRILLEHNADFKLKDSQRQAPLHRAAQEGSVEIIEMILDAYEDDKESAIVEEDCDGCNPFTQAVEAGLRLSTNEAILLHHILTGNSTAVQVFLSVGDCSTFINSPNQQGECPLHFAARYCPNRIVKD